MVKWLQVVARLKPGVSLAQATSEMATIAARLETLYPGGNQGWTAKVRPLREAYIGDAAQTMTVLLGAVFFVLLIACANVAGLMMVLAIGRRREVAVRTALAAPRFRVMRQFLALAYLRGYGIPRYTSGFQSQ